MQFWHRFYYTTEAEREIQDFGKLAQSLSTLLLVGFVLCLFGGLWGLIVEDHRDFSLFIGLLGILFILLTIIMNEGTKYRLKKVLMLRPVVADVGQKIPALESENYMEGFDTLLSIDCVQIFPEEYEQTYHLTIGLFDRGRDNFILSPIEEMEYSLKQVSPIFEDIGRATYEKVKEFSTNFYDIEGVFVYSPMGNGLTIWHYRDPVFIDETLKESVYPTWVGYIKDSKVTEETVSYHWHIQFKTETYGVSSPPGNQEQEYAS